MNIGDIFEHNRRIESDIQKIMAECEDAVQRLVEEDKKWFRWGLKRGDCSEWSYSPGLVRKLQMAKQPYIEQCAKLSMLAIPYTPISPGKILVPPTYIDQPMYEPR